MAADVEQQDEEFAAFLLWAERFITEAVRRAVAMTERWVADRAAGASRGDLNRMDLRPVWRDAYELHVHPAEMVVVDRAAHLTAELFDTAVLPPGVLSGVEDRRLVLRDRSADRMWGDLSAELTAAGTTWDPAGAVERVMGVWRDRWAELWGTWAAVGMLGTVAASTARQAGMRRKRWNSVGDDRVRESHVMLHGTTVAMDEVFYGLNGRLRYPGDPDAPESETARCRCFCSYTA